MPRHNRLPSAQIHLRALRRIQPQPRAFLSALALLLIRPVTLETIIRKDFANIAIEIHRLSRIRNAREYKNRANHKRATKQERRAADHTKYIPRHRADDNRKRHPKS